MAYDLNDYHVKRILNRTHVVVFPQMNLTNYEITVCDCVNRKTF